MYEIFREKVDAAAGELLDLLQVPKCFQFIFPQYGIRTLEDMQELTIPEIDEIENLIQQKKLGEDTIKYDDEDQQMKFFGKVVIDFTLFKFTNRDRQKLAKISTRATEMLQKKEIEMENDNKQKRVESLKKYGKRLLDAAQEKSKSKSIKLDDGSAAESDELIEIVEIKDDDLGEVSEFEMSKWTEKDITEHGSAIHTAVVASANEYLSCTSFKERINLSDVKVEFIKKNMEFKVMIQCCCCNLKFKLNKSSPVNFRLFSFQRHFQHQHILKKGEAGESKAQMKLTDFKFPKPSVVSSQKSATNPPIDESSLIDVDNQIEQINHENINLVGDDGNAVATAKDHDNNGE